METIWIMLVAAALMLLIEKLWPANELPKVDKWWARVIVVNLVQAGIVLVAGRTIDVWFESGNESPWALAQHVGLGWQVAIGYVSITFVYYWWHRVRHESAFFWKLCHQIHHSPRRMEILMSFYKHPVEITLNAIISSSFVYLVLGCSVEAAVLITLATGIAELFYHWQISTPRWLGVFFQRPESHRVHHKKNYHTNNYSDIPLWDMLFGTYENPHEDVSQCGFSAANEDRLDDMLAFRDVHSSGVRDLAPLHLLPSCIGCSKRWACYASRTANQKIELTLEK